MTESTSNKDAPRVNPAAKCSPLAGECFAPFVVVGAGITGLTTALLLQKHGHKVLVLDMMELGDGTTANSSGHLETSADVSLSKLISKFGEQAASLAIDAKRQAIEHIEKWQSELGIDCDFARVPGFLYAESESDAGFIARELNAARKLNLDVQDAKPDELPTPFHAGVRFNNQARIDPRAYLLGLAEAFIERGGVIHTQTRVERVSTEEGQVKLATNRGIVTADAAAMAGHAPLVGMLTMQTRCYASQSYMLDVRIEQDFPDVLLWDTAEPYHYTRRAVSTDARRILVGGADHPTGERIDTATRFSQLESYVRERYKVTSIEGKWSHEFWDSADGLPYIGPLPGKNNIHIATGFSGEGLTYGTAAGIMLCELLRGRDHRWTDVFSPSRIKVAASAQRFTEGMLHIARHFVADRLPSGWKDDIKAIPNDSGALVSANGDRYAVYRDDTGNLHAMSPVCQHLGCVVQWNEAEKTWDCPCHGGRYDCKGNVIAGPPKTSLPKVDLK